MPRQIMNGEEFRELAKEATECRVLKREDTVKLKLRTPNMLYVYKTTEEEAGRLLKGLKTRIVEL